jgi:hypothetical protein
VTPLLLQPLQAELLELVRVPLSAPSAVDIERISTLRACFVAAGLRRVAHNDG